MKKSTIPILVRHVKGITKRVYFDVLALNDSGLYLIIESIYLPICFCEYELQTHRATRIRGNDQYFVIVMAFMWLQTNYNILRSFPVHLAGPSFALSRRQANEFVVTYSHQLDFFSNLIIILL